MKIIHTADVHLDSKLSSHLDSDRAKERRNELIMTFQKMVKYGAEAGAEAIIIAGDLFDVTRISATARNAVLSVVSDNPEMTFYYLTGNHDENSLEQAVTQKGETLPENMKLFGSDWVTYEQVGKDGTDVTITGAELTADNSNTLPASLVLDQDKINIVTLHGMESELTREKGAEIIPLREFRNKGIDYMALGHIHAPKIEKLDARGVYAYSGCLEGRGFDEAGKKGFYMLEITADGVTPEFVSVAERQVYVLDVDVSKCMTSDDVIKEMRSAAVEAGVTSRDMYQAILVGEVDVELTVDETYIIKMLEDEYYVIDIKDKTKPFIDYDSFANDISLRGEFVRLIKAKQQAGELTETMAAQIISTGIGALAGEGVE